MSFRDDGHAAVDWAAAYLERVREATRALIAVRHVLADDLEPIVERAGRVWDFLHGAQGR